MSGASRTEYGSTVLGGAALDAQMLLAVQQEQQQLAQQAGAGAAAPLQMRPRFPGFAAGVEPAGLHASVRAFHLGELARDLKENVCRVFEAPPSAEALAHMPAAENALPDGTVLQVGGARVAVPELLFDPSPVAARHPSAVGLHAAIVTSVTRCDPELRRDLLANVVLTGGGSALAGLPERLARELNGASMGAALHGARARVVQAAPSERAIGPWLGGSILASLGTFPDLWFSEAEYREHGVKAVHRKVV